MIHPERLTLVQRQRMQEAEQARLIRASQHQETQVRTRQVCSLPHSSQLCLWGLCLHFVWTGRTSPWKEGRQHGA